MPIMTTRKMLAILAISVLSSNVNAADMFSPMSDADIVRQIAVTATLMVDYRQTEQIRNYVEAGGKDMYEKNPIIRRHFSEPGVRNYFVVMAVGSAVIAKALPAKWRPVYQYGIIAMQVATIIHNKRFGLSVSF